MEEQLNKMTGEECVAAEDNYYLLSIYMKRRGLKDSEWRSNLHIPYIRRIEKYYRDNELKKYSIKTIIWKTLDSYYSNYFRDKKRLKRNPKAGICSYNTIEEYILYFEKTFDEISNIYIDFERKIISKIMIENILCKIDDAKKRRIVKMLLVGYNKSDIIREMSSSYYELNGNIKDIRKVICEVYKC